MRGLIVGAATLVFILGCQGESNGGDPAAGTTSGSGGRGGEGALDTAGSRSDTGGLSATGGAGGSSGAAMSEPDIEGELVTELDCAKWWSTVVLDDESIFYTCILPPPEFSTDSSYELRRVSGGETEVLATSKAPLHMLAETEDGYFVEEDSGSMRHLAFDSTVLEPFYGANVDETFIVLGQSADKVAVAGHYSQLGTGNVSFSIALANKIGAQPQVPVATGDGRVSAWWLERDGVGWVAGGFDDKPVQYWVSFAGGQAATEIELPSLCGRFARDGDGFVAACGTEAPFDLVRIAADLQVTPIARAVVQGPYDHLYRRDRTYWSHPTYVETTSDTLSVADDAGTVVTRKLASDFEILTLTENYAYLRTKASGTGASVRRIALSDI
jgi:hypothetical protein